VPCQKEEGRLVSVTPKGEVPQLAAVFAVVTTGEEDSSGKQSCYHHRLPSSLLLGVQARVEEVVRPEALLAG
jgi:hypothetical protein